MYELICPACQSKSQHIFVRVGSRVSCAQCQHRYQILAEQVQRNIEIPAQDNTTPNPLLFGSPVTKPPAPAHPAHTPRAPRRQEQRANPDNPPLLTPEVDPTLHPAPKPKPPAEVQRMIAQRRAQRERKRLIIRVICIILGSALPIALLVYMYMMARQIDETSIKSDDGTTIFQNDIGNTVASMDLRALDLVTIKAERLQAPFWRLANNKPFEKPAEEDPIELGPGDTTNSDETNITYIAPYTVHSDKVIELAVLHLALIDAQDRVFATNQIPMTLMSDVTMGLRSRGTIKVKIPNDMAKMMFKMSSYTQVHQYMGNSVALREPMIESQIVGEDATLLIAAYNPLDKPLARCVFSVQAIDNHGNELAHWRVNWQRMIDPRQRVEFKVSIPISRLWTIGGWKLVAFGETEKLP